MNAVTDKYKVKKVYVQRQHLLFRLAPIMPFSNFMFWHTVKAGLVFISNGTAGRNADNIENENTILSTSMFSGFIFKTSPIASGTN